MLRVHPFAIAALVAAVPIVLDGARTSADAGANRFKLGKTHRLRVTHTTRVRVEAGTTALKVEQAKPLSRAFAGLKPPLGVETVTFSPKGATDVATVAPGGTSWTWTIDHPAEGVTDYVSTFDVVAADHELKSSGLALRWDDLPKDLAEAMKDLPPLPVAPERLRDVVAQIRKKKNDLLDGVTAMAAWVRAHIAYTGGVAYGINDLDAILRGGAGHCGHRATVFLALCQAAGIPARRVVGYALENKDGLIDGHEDANRHVWVEISLPTLGWIEVEPAPAVTPFAIPFNYLRNPGDFQSCRVTGRKDGERSAPAFEDTLRMVELK